MKPDPTFLRALLSLLVLSAIFLAIERVFGRGRAQPILRRGWWTDVVYWFATILFTKPLTRLPECCAPQHRAKPMQKETTDEPRAVPTATEPSEQEGREERKEKGIGFFPTFPNFLFKDSVQDAPSFGVLMQINPNSERKNRPHSAHNGAPNGAVSHTACPQERTPRIRLTTEP